MFGLGGTLVGVLRDIAFRIVPLTRQDAKSTIKEMRGFHLLGGIRAGWPSTFPISKSCCSRSRQ